MKEMNNPLVDRKIIAVDMDDTIAFLMKAMQKDHNEKHPDHPLEYEDMVAFDESMFHPAYDKMDFFRRKDTFYNLEAMDYAYEELQEINKDYDLLIVTSAFPETVHDKWRWLQKHFPFVSFANFITASRKDLILADILIDDAIHNVKSWVDTGRHAIAIRHHWNTELEQMDNVTMMDGWKGMKSKIDYLLTKQEVRW